MRKKDRLEEISDFPSTRMDMEYGSVGGTQDNGQEEQERYRERTASQRKRVKKCCMLFSSAVAGVVVIYNSFGIDLLKNDIFADVHLEETVSGEIISESTVPEPDISEPAVSEPTTTQTGRDEPEMEGEYADEEFPVLPNMAVDTVMNEDFIIVADADNPDGVYIHLNDRLIGNRGTIENITYDEETNTLVLDNAGADVIVANLMGNGFKVELVGESHIGTIIVYGFYYGGSVTFTGGGSLYVNESRENDIGILLEAEYSKSCIMVDRNVTIESYGTEAAIMVFDTKADKGLYYLKPQKLEGGVRCAGDRREYGVSGEESNGERDDWTIVDADDETQIARKVIISPVYN